MPDLPAAAPGYDPPIRAPLGWRLGARACDVIILAWLSAVVLAEVEGHLFGVDVYSLSGGALLAVVAAISFVLEVVPVAAWRASPGKALLGLQVVAASTGGPVPVTASILRWLLFYGVILVPLVGWAFLAVNTAVVVLVGRGLHDRAAGTTVVSAAGRHSP